MRRSLRPRQFVDGSDEDDLGPARREAGALVDPTDVRPRIRDAVNPDRGQRSVRPQPGHVPPLEVSDGRRCECLAGIDVRVMIAPRGAEFSPAYRAGYTYAADMVRAGVKVLLYQGAYFHSKTVCVDSAICSIGSANMDIRSFSINYETNLVIYHAGVTRELEADFAADERRCVPFSADEYEARGGASRLVDSMLRLCSPLL